VKVLAVLLALVAALAGAARLLSRDPRQRNLEVLPADMVRSPALKSGGTTDLFEDGIVQRTAPEGTIARGALPFPFGPSLEEAARAGAELENPVAATPEVLARGEFVFATWCSACHGAGGLGDAPITKRGFPPPPSLLRPESKALRDGEIYHALVYGRKNMPSPAGLVAKEDRWKVIRYLRRLQEGAK